MSDLIKDLRIQAGEHRQVAENRLAYIGELNIQIVELRAENEQLLRIISCFRSGNTATAATMDEQPITEAATGGGEE